MSPLGRGCLGRSFRRFRDALGKQVKDKVGTMNTLGEENARREKRT